MSENLPSVDAGALRAVPTFRPVPDIAELLGIPVTRVHQLLRDRTVVSARVNGVLSIPEEFIQDGAVVKGLAGTITLLTDAGFSDDDIVGWLFYADPTLLVENDHADGDRLSATAIGSLRRGWRKEVHRRAQAAGF